MFPQRNIFRLAQRSAQQTRFAPVRSTVQRRFNSTEGSSKFPWAVDNEFNREREAVQHHAAATSGMFPSSDAVIPALVLGSLTAYNLWEEHWDHWDHMPPLEERTEYPYQNIRVKNYPWGDGDKTIFWNSTVNYHNKDKAT
ncbi:cytochrome c oxidase subunit VIa [Aspergillus affinis]|uniref:cytochrome c oxidase subunit VIa n=1 Tax=Aspergillus affinis TaxID=1070780 RepID=UPI0022FE0006|nr:putative cytochrome c oxidase subunit VIa [Aspergillus affinis]KAI9035432.1 putative cytochrome c oxidase subunit VIa [Aspergillus affinis]